MQPRLGVAAPAVPLAPPYPAELLIPPGGWASRLAHNGIVYLNKPEVHLGLLATNDVVFRDPHVSRLHAVIRWTPAGYEVEDLNSTGGTYVQGQRVIGRMLLPHGATIRIGTVDMRFQPVAAPQPAHVYPTPPGYPIAAPIATHPSRLRAWVRRQAPKRYWRVFLLGLLAYIAADLLVNFDLNRHAIPLVILLASALVPVTFVIFCWEEGAFADMPATIVGLTFVSGAVMGLLVAGFLEDIFLLDVPIVGPFIVGIIEEGAKATAVIWFLRDKRLRSELDGLVLGAAAGMGFATLETAGYGFNAFLGGYTNAMNNHSSMSGAVSAGLASMTFVLILRMALAIFGHGAWTAIVCAAIWRERGPAVLRITGSVAPAFCIAVTLHALWDSVGAFLPLSLLLWPFVAFSGLWILRFFIHEAVDRAKLGSLAPPPAPLFAALLTYLLHPRRRPTIQPLHGPPAMVPATTAPMAGGYGPMMAYPPSYPPAGYPIYPPTAAWQGVSPSSPPIHAPQPPADVAIMQPRLAPDPANTPRCPDDEPAAESPQTAPQLSTPEPVAPSPGVPGWMCPNGHFVADATPTRCPECDSPMPGMPLSNPG